MRGDSRPGVLAVLACLQLLPSWEGDALLGPEDVRGGQGDGEGGEDFAGGAASGKRSRVGGNQALSGIFASLEKVVAAVDV